MMTQEVDHLLAQHLVGNEPRFENMTCRKSVRAKRFRI